MIDSAQGSDYGNRDIFAPLSIIEDRDPLSRALETPRINQQMLLPASVKSRILGDIITSTQPTNSTQPTTSKPIVISNGKSASFLFTVSDNDNRAIIAMPQPAIYVTSIADNNLWPNATYNMTNLPVCIYNDPTESDGANVVTRVEVGNSTGADQTVIVTCSWRVIVQPNTVLNSATTTASVSSTGP